MCVCVCVCIYIYREREREKERERERERDFHGNLCVLRTYLCDDVLTRDAEVLQNMYCALIGSWDLVFFVVEKLEIAL